MLLNIGVLLAQSLMCSANASYILFLRFVRFFMLLFFQQLSCSTTSMFTHIVVNTHINKKKHDTQNNTSTQIASLFKAKVLMNQIAT